jgi:hypothetical protein
MLRLVGDLHALAAGVLAETGDARRDRGGPGFGRGVGREVGLGDRTDDEDLVAIGAHVDRTDIQPVGESAGEPSLDLVERCVVVSVSSWVLHAMKITSLHGLVNGGSMDVNGLLLGCRWLVSVRRPVAEHQAWGDVYAAPPWSPRPMRR